MMDMYTKGMVKGVFWYNCIHVLEYECIMVCVNVCIVVCMV